MEEVYRGQIYFCNLQTGGSVTSGKRPVLVVQNDKGNKYSNTTVVCPITSRLAKKRYPTHVEVAPIDSGLYCTSVIKCEHITTVDKGTLKDYVGELKPEIMAEVSRAIKLQLGI